MVGYVKPSKLLKDVVQKRLTPKSDFPKSLEKKQRAQNRKSKKAASADESLPSLLRKQAE